MAASVHELLAAAQADKSPFISMLEGAAQGFQSQQMHPLDVQAKQVAIQRQQQSLEFDKMLRTAYEQTIKEQLNSVTSDDDGGPLPEQKIQTLVSIGRGGPRVYQVQKPKAQKYAKQQSVYEDENGQIRRGSFDPATGEVKRSDTDPVVPVPKRGEGRGNKPTTPTVKPKTPSQMLSENSKAFKIAMDLYVKAHPDKAVTDTFTGKVVDHRLTEADVQGEEFVGLFERSKTMLAEGRIAVPAPVAQDPQSVEPPIQGSSQSPEEYLKSINAKITPANIEWAKKKMGGK